MLRVDAAGVDATAWGVLVGGVLLIALVLWYFFGEREAARAEAAGGEAQEVSRRAR